MTRPDPNAYPVTFFGKMLTFSRIKLTTNDFDVITAHIAEVSPNKDSQIPIIIDTDVEIDLKQLIDLLWEWGLQPIGVTRGVLDEQAEAMRLAIFPADGKRMQRVAPQSRETSAPIPDAPITPMQERFAQQIQALKKSPNQNNNENEDEDDSQVQSLELDFTNNHPSELKKQGQRFFNTAPPINNQSHNLINSELPASELKKNTLFEIQQAEFDGTRTSGSTKPTTSKTTVNTSNAFIEAPQANDRITSKVHNKMLRSGQNVNHLGGDLILINSVNDGAEAITDNSLHIYGKGMGRLVAGATGDPDAHIFCQRFNPSLVSVAGTYMLRDNIPPEFINKAVQVSYKENEGLVFRIMDDWSQIIEKNTIEKTNN